MNLTHGSARLLIGDVFDRMAELPDGSIDLVVTSPPFLALRSYLPADHPDKALEIGSEATPAEFLDTLLRLTAEWRRLLAPHGSIAIELGDTYAGSGGAGGDYGPDGLRAGQPKFAQRWVGEQKRAMDDRKRTFRSQPRDGYAGGGPGWPLDKSLSGIPTLYTWSLAYGRNLLDSGSSPAGMWRIRNLIPWCRPNPPVGALGDKCRPATSYITVATIARNRWWDMEDCRTELQPHGGPSRKNGAKFRSMPGDGVSGGLEQGRARFEEGYSNPAGAPLLDYWVIPTQPYKGAHYATFPSELPARLIKLMCPRDVCTTCGEPRRRIVAPTDEYTAARNGGGDFSRHDRGSSDLIEGNAAKGNVSGFTAQRTTLGWTDCGHNTWRPGIVLDPFAGSGTTLAAATGLGRAAIGIDLDARNADLARQRVGMFLDVDGEGHVSTTSHNPTGNPRFRVGYQHGNPTATGDKKDYGEAS